MLFFWDVCVKIAIKSVIKYDFDFMACSNKLVDVKKSKRTLGFGVIFMFVRRGRDPVIYIIRGSMEDYIWKKGSREIPREGTLWLK